MSDKTTGHKLYSEWLSHYKKHKGSEYKGQRYRDSATMQRIAEDVGVHRFSRVMKRHIEEQDDPEIVDLVFGFHEVEDAQQARDENRAAVRSLKQRTKQLMEERS